MNSATITANRRHRKASIGVLKRMIILGPYQAVSIDTIDGGKSYMIRPDDIERAKRTIEHLEELI